MRNLTLNVEPQHAIGMGRTVRAAVGDIETREAVDELGHLAGGVSATVARKLQGGERPNARQDEPNQNRGKRNEKELAEGWECA